jgi:2-polyprenyl-3-methyl-5-hydroxy-6-metoxy-1,4-benzoquinol methylase
MANDTPDRLRQEVRDVWDANADFWDGRMAEGNEFHNLLIEPAQLRLLELGGGEMVLDVACGNGQFARKMADVGAHVLAVDVSGRMIENAKRRSAGYQGRIDYRVIDCADPAQLSVVGERQFDRVVCTMALMDMPDIEPLASAASKLLRPGGRFVFSVLHPCFNSGLTRHGIERHDIGGELIEEPYVRVSRYAEPVTVMGVAMAGQPVPQHYFHRPLSVLLGTFFEAGFVQDGLEEPVFPAEAGASLFRTVFSTVPAAHVARLRLG